MWYSCTVLYIHRTMSTISTVSPGSLDLGQAAYDSVLSTGGHAGASQLPTQQIHSLDALRKLTATATVAIYSPGKLYIVIKLWRIIISYCILSFISYYFQTWIEDILRRIVAPVLNYQFRFRPLGHNDKHTEERTAALGISISILWIASGTSCRLSLLPTINIVQQDVNQMSEKDGKDCIRSMFSEISTELFFSLHVLTWWPDSSTRLSQGGGCHKGPFSYIWNGLAGGMDGEWLQGCEQRISWTVWGVHSVRQNLSLSPCEKEKVLQPEAAGLCTQGGQEGLHKRYLWHWVVTSTFCIRMGYSETRFAPKAR